MKPLISVIVHTASPDNFLSDIGIPSAMKSLSKTLDKQTFLNFELIYVDYYKDQNTFPKCSFPVKHVSVHPLHRYWHDKQRPHISAAKNTGIIYSSGELIISFDDAEIFESNILQRYWDEYQKGKYLHASHRRIVTVEIQDGIPILDGSQSYYIDDARQRHSGQRMEHNNGSLLYAGTSFTLQDALNINGFEERMDSCKALEDSHFGIRLERLGRKFVFEPKSCVYILPHKPLYKTNGIHEQIYIENHGFVEMARLGILKANQQLAQEDIETIRRDTIQFKHFDPFAEERKAMTSIWQNTPLFNLKEHWEMEHQ